MPVKSLVTFPRSGIQHQIDKPLAIRGHAWAGDHQVSAMAVSIDFGATWSNCELQAPKKIVSPGRWTNFPQPGYYEVWARDAKPAHGSARMESERIPHGGRCTNSGLHCVGFGLESAVQKLWTTQQAKDEDGNW